MTEKRAARRGCRYFFNLLLAAIVGFIFSFNFVLPVFIANRLVYLRQPIGTVTPTEFGLSYEDVVFNTSDGLTLSGWYIPSQNGAVVILVHGSNGNRAGTLNHAAMVARHGYGALLFDLRGHGSSDGERFTWGWDANLDIDAALDYLASRPDVIADRIGILGLSMGGEVALQAAAHTDRIQAVISDGAGARTIDDFLMLPDSPNKWMMLPFMWTQFTAHGVFAGVTAPPTFGELLPQITPRPVLFIYAGRGMWGEIGLTRPYFDAAREPKTLWEIPEATHVGGLTARLEEYEQRVVQFFDETLLSS